MSTKRPQDYAQIAADRQHGRRENSRRLATYGGHRGRQPSNIVAKVENRPRLVILPKKVRLGKYE